MGEEHNQMAFRMKKKNTITEVFLKMFWSKVRGSRFVKKLL